ncbi:hypothetical protein HYH02_010683 [Chlamydomonas schloesseri]|uniref:Thiamine pyrophosphate enzyme N-terminal TPP-binding domain-containing protein n=1 Tax=Chlamydomonas schloesseri TaxID=2026947 RepID=A0A835T7J1_9CHLO|nr:hypothetical protein HYH02_010683 [Chlamydomonas schloesseri]|eukprot:KAG2438886.1 hypothetical protein HYH02_010683 [Chlamydomonas schloesseri]
MPAAAAAVGNQPHAASGSGVATASIAAGPAAVAAAATAAASGTSSSATTGAEAALRAAVVAGADVCFANPGTTEMWMVAALDAVWPAVRPVLCLHETVATGAADGYARLSRRPALTLLHLGPGLANGLANLHNARRARSPVVNLEAAAELRRYGCVVLVDALPPVANFGYRGAPGKLLPGSEDSAPAPAAAAAAPQQQPQQSQPDVWEFDPQALRAAGWDAAAVLTRLAAALGPAAAAVRPGFNCRGVFTPCLPSRPPLPPSCFTAGDAAGSTGSGGSGHGDSGGGSRLTAAELCAVVAALQPAGCVLVDESLTSGGSYWEASKGCPPFTHLTLTGGAIGSGPPLALGAALALGTRATTASNPAPPQYSSHL